MNVQTSLQTLATYIFNQRISSNPQLKTQLQANPALLTQLNQQCYQQAQVIIASKLKQDWKSTFSQNDRRLIIENLYY